MEQDRRTYREGNVLWVAFEGCSAEDAAAFMNVVAALVKAARELVEAVDKQYATYSIDLGGEASAAYGRLYEALEPFEGG